MSIRDIHWAVWLFEWLVSPYATVSQPSAINLFLPEKQVAAGFWDAAIVAVMMTYYIRLFSEGHLKAKASSKDLRKGFIDALSVCLDEVGLPAGLPKVVFDQAVQCLWSFARVALGIAHTRALKENYFSVVLCFCITFHCLITGPPGYGKTLAFLIAMNNLAGTVTAHRP